MIKYILCALLGYFAGCFSPSYLLSRRRGFDIRTFGSGNAGATNMMLAAGLKPGLVVMALDVSKAFVVTFPLRLLLPPLCAALAGLFCVLGHIFPVFLHFRGGKGTACLCGTVLGLTPELVLPLLALMFIIGMIWNRASILPLLTALVYAPLYLLRTGDWRGTIALALIFPAMLWAHRSNFARWREGKEQTFRQFLLAATSRSARRQGNESAVSGPLPAARVSDEAVRSQLLQHFICGGAAALARSGRRTVHAQPRGL